MILVDTGPWVAQFDPKDEHHSRCKGTLAAIKESLSTTVPVLTEAFHILEPQSTGSSRLRDFIAQRGASVWDFDRGSLLRAFELMETYGDRRWISPMHRSSSPPRSSKHARCLPWTAMTFKRIGYDEVTGTFPCR
jgi:hypothetical protein